MTDLITQYRPVLDWAAVVLAPAAILAMGKLFLMLREARNLESERKKRDDDRDAIFARERDALNLIISRLTKEIDFWRESLRKDSESAAQQFDNLRTQIATLRGENKDQQEEMRGLHKQIEAGERENVRLRDENDRLRSEVAHLRAEVEHLTAQLAPGAMK